MKKILALILIINLAFAPIASASLAQNQVGLGAIGVGATGVVMALATGTAVALTGGLALAAVGAVILIDSAASSSSTPATSTLSIRLNPNVPLITPDGWTAAVPPSIKPTPPASYTPSYAWTSPGVGTHTDPAAFCTAFWANYVYAAQYPSGRAYDVNATTQALKCGGNYQGGTFEYVITTQKSTSCDAGYTLTGTSPSQTCNLSNANLVTKPEKEKMEIYRDGNELKLDANINPNDIIPSDIVQITPSKVTVNHGDGSKTEVEIKSNGTSTVTVTSPTEGGTTTKHTTNFSPPDGDGNVTVTGKSQGTVDGQGDLQGSGTGSEIEFPTDYNREATQQEIRDDTEEIKDGITNAENHSVELDNAKDDYDEKADAHEAEYEGIGERGLDDHGVDTDFEKPMMGSAGCSAFSMPVNGGTSSIDFCDKTNTARDIIGWIFYVLTAWGIFGIFTAKRE